LPSWDFRKAISWSTLLEDAGATVADAVEVEAAELDEEEDEDDDEVLGAASAAARSFAAFSAAAAFAAFSCAAFFAAAAAFFASAAACCFSAASDASIAPCSTASAACWAPSVTVRDDTAGAAVSLTAPFDEPFVLARAGAAAPVSASALTTPPTSPARRTHVGSLGAACRRRRL